MPGDGGCSAGQPAGGGGCPGGGSSPRQSYPGRSLCRADGGRKMSALAVDDIRTVVWKESRSLFKFQQNRSRYLFLIIPPVLLGLVFPWSWGPDWVSEIPTLILAFITPV